MGVNVSGSESQSASAGTDPSTYVVESVGAGTTAGTNKSVAVGTSVSAGAGAGRGKDWSAHAVMQRGTRDRCLLRGSDWACPQLTI